MPSLREAAAPKLTVVGTIRVMKWRGSWCIFSCGVPILEGFESEADTWIGLAGLCLERSKTPTWEE